MTTSDIEAIRRLADAVGERSEAMGGPRLPIVAFAGGTGSGKSSLVNALAGAAVSLVGELRPTTSEAIAVFPQGVPTEVPELDRLGVIRRVHGAHEGFVMVDLPDLDSVVAGHRRLAEAVLEHADAIVWVVDPEKYADAVLHEAVRRFDDIPSAVACNHADRLPGHERLELLEDVGRRFGDRPVVPTSVPRGHDPVGVESLASWVHAVEAARFDRATRLAVRRWLAAAGTPHEPPAVDAWADVEGTLGGFVTECAQRADDRLGGAGARHALLGIRSHPVRPADAPRAPRPPDGWPTGPSAIRQVEASWDPAVARLVDAADASALMADSAVVNAAGWWAWARWSVPVAVVAGVVAGVLGTWWAVATAAVVGVALVVVLAVSGRRAGRRAAQRVRGEVGVLWDAAVGSDTVTRHRRACAAADELAAAAAAVADLRPT